MESFFDYKSYHDLGIGCPTDLFYVDFHHNLRLHSHSNVLLYSFMKTFEFKFLCDFPYSDLPPPSSTGTACSRQPLRLLVESSYCCYITTSSLVLQPTSRSHSQLPPSLAGALRVHEAAALRALAGRDPTPSPYLGPCRARPRQSALVRRNGSPGFDSTASTSGRSRLEKDITWDKIRVKLEAISIKDRGDREDLRQMPSL